MNFLTDRKRAQGLGSSGKGTHHHWQMMVSSIAICIVIPVFLITFGLGLGGTREEVLAYFGRPFPAIVTLLAILVVINHTMMEVISAVEDYVHGNAQKLTLMAVQFFGYTLMAVGVFAVARLAL